MGAVFVLVFPEALVYGEFTLTLAFQLQDGGDTGEKSLWIGAVDSQVGSGPKALALRKQTQIQILNIHKNQNGDIFDLLPTCLTFFSFFLFFFKIKLLEYGVWDF